MFFQRLLFRKYLDKDENLLFVIHRHWITIQDQMMKIGFIGYAVPIAMMAFFSGFTSPIAYFFYLWVSLAICYSFYVFLDWYLDSWLLTNISIIDTSWDGFFKQRSSRIEYHSIESINIETSGIYQTLFNYGSIIIVRNSGVNITMETVSNPQLCSSWISKIQSEMVSQRNTRNAESIKNLLADIIEEHIKVNS